MAGKIRLFEKREDGSLSEVTDEAKAEALRSSGYTSRVALEIDVAFTDAEILERQAEEAKAQKTKAARLEEQQKQEELQNSAKAKLAALGLSDEEIAALSQA